MNSQAILKVWQDLLGPHVSVSAGPLLDRADPLTVNEILSAGELNSQRLREFKSGRSYAKRALAMLGVNNSDLPVAPDRSPVWPKGIVGSITHFSDCGAGHVAAAAALMRDFRGIGIDVESEEGLHPSVWSFVLTANEYGRLLRAPPNERAAKAQILWCAKEAVIKAARQPIEPAMIEIDFAGREFAAALHDSADIGKSRAWRGRALRAHSLILAAAFEHAGPQTGYSDRGGERRRRPATVPFGTSEEWGSRGGGRQPVRNGTL